MRANLAVDGGLILAEAYMMTLAPSLGREEAHDLVYVAARDAREGGRTLHDAVQTHLDRRALPPIEPVRPEDYLGEAQVMCDAALRHWRNGAP